MGNAAAALYSRLSLDTGVIAIVGTAIYPEVAPEDAAYPHIVYDASDEAEYPMSASGPIGIAIKKVKVYCLAGSYSDMNTLAAAVRSSLNGAAGTFGGTVVQGVFLDNENESRDIGAGNAQQKVSVSEQDYTIIFET